MNQYVLVLLTPYQPQWKMELKILVGLQSDAESVLFGEDKEDITSIDIRNVVYAHVENILKRRPWLSSYCRIYLLVVL